VVVVQQIFKFSVYLSHAKYLICSLLLVACVGLFFGLRPKEARLSFVGYEFSRGNCYAVLGIENRSKRPLGYFEDRDDPEPDAVLHVYQVKGSNTWSDPVWDWRAATNSLERIVSPGRTVKVKVLVVKQPKRVALRLHAAEPDGPPWDFGTGAGLLIWDRFKLGSRVQDRMVDVWCPTEIQTPEL
jgi:hypothetical protein